MQTRRSFIRRGVSATGAISLARCFGTAAFGQGADAPDWQRNALGAYAYNSDLQLRSALVAHSNSEAAAVEALAHARANGTPFAIRSSGHCFAGLSQNREMVIDLSGMNAVTPIGADRVIAQTGARLGDVYAALGPMGRVVPLGTCQNVALGGLATGGGIGPYSRAFGLTCDTMLRARIILADGQIVTASASENPDLFWALRGGGAANFGILTEAEFQSFEVGEVTILRYFWEGSPEMVARVIEAWQRRAPALPRRMNSFLVIRSVGSQFVQALGYLITFDDHDRARQAALDFYDIQKPSIDPPIVFGSPDRMASDIWPRDYNPSHPRKVISFFQTAPTPAAQWEAILQRLREDPSWNVSIVLDLMGGAINDLAPTDSAFPHRGIATMTAQFDSVLDDRAPRAAQIARLVDLTHLVQDQSAEGRAYLNYADRDLPHYAQAYWGENLARLQEIKARYDPLNLFNGPQSIPLNR